MQDTEQTSSLSKCDTEGHITKITKTEYYLEDGDVKERVILYGCTRCDATSETVWDTFGQVSGNKDPTAQCRRC